MSYGKNNIAIGLLFLAAFMAYGFLLIWLRDFAPGKEEWVAAYSTGKHFEARLAHVHGNLFALLNILVGFLLLKLPFAETPARWVSWLSLGGLLMPVGIVAEIVLGASPIFVLLGAVSIVVAMLWLGIAALQMRVEPS